MVVLRVRAPRRRAWCGWKGRLGDEPVPRTPQSLPSPETPEPWQVKSQEMQEPEPNRRLPSPAPPHRLLLPDSPASFSCSPPTTTTAPRPHPHHHHSRPGSSLPPPRAPLQLACRPRAYNCWTLSPPTEAGGPGAALADRVQLLEPLCTAGGEARGAPASENGTKVFKNQTQNLTAQQLHSWVFTRRSSSKYTLVAASLTVVKRGKPPSWPSPAE